MGLCVCIGHTHIADIIGGSACCQWPECGCNSAPAIPLAPSDPATRAAELDRLKRRAGYIEVEGISTRDAHLSFCCCGCSFHDSKSGACQHRTLSGYFVGGANSICANFWPKALTVRFPKGAS